MFRLFSRTTDTQGLCGSRLFNNESFYKSFTSDLRYAKQRVYIESPFITKRRIDELLPAFEGLRRRGIAVTVNTRCPDEHDGEYVRQASDGFTLSSKMTVSGSRWGVSISFALFSHFQL